jgi:SAM-dependent methyltransferase
MPDDALQKALASLSTIEDYRLRACKGDVFGLSCHEGDPEAPAFHATSTLVYLPLQPQSVLVDVGCGEGTLLAQAAETVTRGRLIGIVPTPEELSAVTAHLGNPKIEIRQGLAEATGLPSDFADFVVCNNVLLLVPRPELALQEIARIAKAGAAIHIGSQPFADEFADRRYKNSILRVLASALKNGGPVIAAKAFAFVLRELANGRLHYLGRSKVFWIAPPDFAALTARCGLAVIESHMQRRRQRDGSIVETETRKCYVLRRTDP